MQTEEVTEKTLQTLADAAKTARLSPADEDIASGLLKEALASGKKGLAPALDALVVLPWNIGVKAVGEGWPEMKPLARTQFLNALGKLDTDAAKRIRLSLARGLFPLDKPATLKLIAGVCAAMDGTEGGPTARDRQAFAGVLFGQAKPWLLHLPLAEWKAAEADPVLRCALAASQSQPFTQIWVLRWIADAGKLAELPAEQLEAIAKSAQRWHPKLKKDLKKLVPELPAVIGDALAPPAPAARPEAKAETREASAPPAPTPQRRPAGEAPPRRERNATASHFDLGSALHEIDDYVGRLRAELQQAQAVRREPSRGRASAEPIAATGEDAESLRRHNVQLQETVEDLRRQLEELSSDHEDRAAALQGGDELQQFKTFLGVKLGKDFADFEVLRDEPATEVVRRHLGGLLDHLFTVLQGEGVKFVPPE